VLSGKRKAAAEAVAPLKKTKLANGDAAVTDDTTSRTVFVGRLSWNVDNDRLKSEFEECGEVVAARVQMDRNTGKSRGFAYVEFADPASVEKALEFSGKEIDGRPINVDRSTNNKASGGAGNPNEARRAAYGDKTNPPSSVLFVGNLSWEATEDSIWDVFGEYGDVKGVRLPTDRDSGRMKGYGYIEFFDTDSAKKAFESTQGMELLGRALRIDYSQPREEGGGGRGFGRGGGRGGFDGGGGRGFGRGGGRGGFDGGRGGGRGGRGGRGGFDGGRVSIRLFLPRLTDVSYALRVVAVVVAVVLPAGGVAVVAAHGQVVSPNLRVKRSHSIDFCGYLLSLATPGICFCLDTHVWSVMYASLFWPFRPVHILARFNARDYFLLS
jgi:nucleolin